MIIRTGATSRRKGNTASLRERVAQQLDSQRKQRSETCEHWFVRGKCVTCGRKR